MTGPRKAQSKSVREKGRSRRFDDPVPLPGGGELKTLREAIAYLARTVPKAEQAMPEVLAAAEILTRATELEIAWMFLARIATLRAFHRNGERLFNPDRKESWGKRKLKRDE